MLPNYITAWHLLWYLWHMLPNCTIARRLIIKSLARDTELHYCITYLIMSLAYVTELRHCSYWATPLHDVPLSYICHMLPNYITARHLLWYLFGTFLHDISLICLAHVTELHHCTTSLMISLAHVTELRHCMTSLIISLAHITELHFCMTSV